MLNFTLFLYTVNHLFIYYSHFIMLYYINNTLLIESLLYIFVLVISIRVREYMSNNATIILFIVNNCIVYYHYIDDFKEYIYTQSLLLFTLVGMTIVYHFMFKLQIFQQLFCNNN